LVDLEAFDKGADDPYAASLLDQLRKDQKKIEADGYRGDFATP